MRKVLALLALAVGLQAATIATNVNASCEVYRAGELIQSETYNGSAQIGWQNLCDGFSIEVLPYVQFSDPYIVILPEARDDGKGAGYGGAFVSLYLDFWFQPVDPTDVIRFDVTAEVVASQIYTTQPGYLIWAFTSEDTDSDEMPYSWAWTTGRLDQTAAAEWTLAMSSTAKGRGYARGQGHFTSWAYRQMDIVAYLDEYNEPPPIESPEPSAWMLAASGVALCFAKYRLSRKYY